MTARSLEIVEGRTLCGPCTDKYLKHGTDPRCGCKACDKLQALAELRALLPPGSTVYTILRSVSRSGMSRVISPVMIQNGEPRPLTHLVKLVLEERVRFGFQNGLVVNGGGMDMGFHLVHSLSYALHGHDASAPIFTAPAMRLTMHDNLDALRPGYTLTHRWL